jgi:hypothetical protein
MEPIRAQKVDSFVLDWLRREPLQRKWFFEERNGNCRLTSEFAAKLSETSRLWRQALGPVAEWIAHELWTVTSRAPKEKAPATRLTQNRKREPKGIPPAEQALRLIRENHLKLPKPFGATAHDPIAQARRAETQRRQNAAKKEWSPSEKPEWLHKKFYSEQVQPRLLAVQVTTIQAALSVSEPYALKIRNGLCLPHPRHWLTLAHLLGIKCRSESDKAQ